MTDNSFLTDIQNFVQNTSPIYHKTMKTYRWAQYNKDEPNRLKNLGKIDRLYIIGHGDFDKDYLIGQFGAPDAPGAPGSTRECPSRHDRDGDRHAVRVLAIRALRR